MLKIIKKVLIHLNLLKLEFDGQIFIYIDEKGNPSKLMTDTVKWLELISVKCYKKNADGELLKMAYSIHPELDKRIMHIF